MKFTHILMAIAVPAAAFLTSCGGDDPTQTKPKPGLSFQTGAGYTFSEATAVFDSVLVIGIRATTADKQLNTIKVYLSTNGSAKGVILDTATNKGIFSYDFPYKVKGSAGDVQTLEVEVVDDNGEMAVATLKINIKKVAHPLDQIGGQLIANIIGPDPGAYDLNTGFTKISSDPEEIKDLKDMTTISSGVFSKAWTSGNGTKFVKITTNDWNNATNTESLYDLWTTHGANAQSTVTNLAVGDIVLAKTGQTNISFNIYMIKIDKVFETTTNNNDYIEFTYRKEQN
ncbi:MAG: hypothetical protein KG003_03745 [Bacteroidetes bacterium]|nr:hypothetical protein [Bacteroidota bacterium]